MGLKEIIEGVRSQRTQRVHELPLPDFNLDEEEHRVLIVYFFNGLGDAALLAPVLAAIKARHSDLELAILAPSIVARTIKLFDLPVRIHEISQDLMRSNRRTGGQLAKRLRTERANLEQELRACNYTIGVDLSCRDGIDARVWLKKAEAYTRIGWIRNRSELEQKELDFGTLDIRSNTDRHWSYANMLPFESIVSGAPRFDLDWKLTQRKKKQSELRWTSGKKILVIPGSENEAKRWRTDSFAFVLAQIDRHMKTSVIVSGGPSEKELVLSLKKKIKHPSGSFTGKDLKTLVALIQTADLVITNDTGPMHLAFLSRVPTIAIFTRMSPTVWGPPLKSPCFRVHCPLNDEDHESLESALLADCLELLGSRI